MEDVVTAPIINAVTREEMTGQMLSEIADPDVFPAHAAPVSKIMRDAALRDKKLGIPHRGQLWERVAERGA